MKKILKFIIAGIVVIAAAGIAFALYDNKPRTKKKKEQQRRVPVVQVLPLAPTEEKVMIEAYGTVVPARQLTVKPEVGGKIIAMNPDLAPGGIIAAGGLLFQIDPSDYRFVLNERRADVAEARYKLELEQGQQIIAAKEWQLLEKEGAAPKGASRALAMREPHLKFARAQLEAAESRLAAAELNLARTTVTAPFNALVLDEAVEQGQVVSSQAIAATLVDVDRFWVQASVPADRLERIRFSGKDGSAGSKAVISLHSGTEKTVSRTGRVLRLLGDLDPKGRMARVLVAVDDPLGRTARTGKVLLGSYVKVAIEAGIVPNVYVIPRMALRENDTLWLAGADGSLVMRPASVRWRRQDDVLVAMPATPGEMLITSRLQSPLPGMALKIAGKEE